MVSFQKYGNDGELLSLDDTILKYFNIHGVEFEPTNSSLILSYVINGLSFDLGFGRYLVR